MKTTKEITGYKLRNLSSAKLTGAILKLYLIENEIWEEGRDIAKDSHSFAKNSAFYDVFVINGLLDEYYEGFCPPPVEYDTDRLSFYLYQLQDNVIGLFKPSFSDMIEMVVDNENGHLRCVTIGNLGGLHTLHIDESQGELIMFTNGRYLSDIMKDPMEYQTITNSLKKPILY